jgi:RNA polymerase sigma-70 factor (ECF subfamily)
MQLTNESTNAVQSKSREDFAYLYDNYSAALFSIVNKLLRQSPAAEDVLQEAFVKIWRSIDTYDPHKGTIFTWMLNITRNCCIDYLRSMHYQQKVRLADNRIEHVINLIPDKKSLFGHEGLELSQLTGKPDDGHTEILNLVYIYGYTMVEVSKMLDMPVSTIKTRCRAAIKKIGTSTSTSKNK